MMVDYRSVIMYIIWSHGLLPTTVLVDWFLELELPILWFSPSRSHIKLDINQTYYDLCLLINDDVCCFESRFSDHIRSGSLVSRAKMAFFLYFLHSKWQFMFDLNQTWYNEWFLVVGDIIIIFHGSVNMTIAVNLFA